MSLLLRNVSKLNTIGAIRPYSQVVNVFGRRNVDTKGLEEVKDKKIAAIPENAESVKEVSEHPEEQVSARTARIFVSPKNAMQSGTYQTKEWRVEFDNRQRWENPLMGWGSTSDPLSSMTLKFGSKEDAIVYCQRMGFNYVVETPNLIKKAAKSYGANFSWSKKTRVSTK